MLSQVIVLDNFFTGSQENIAQHMGKTNFEFIRHDVVEPILLEARSASKLIDPSRSTATPE